MNPQEKIEQLIAQESGSKRFLPTPENELGDNEEVIGTLSKREIAILSALKKAEFMYKDLKNNQEENDLQMIIFYEKVISGLKRILSANIFCRFKTKHTCFKVRKNWQLTVDAS